MSRSERARIEQQVYDQWVQEATELAVPQAKYQRDGRSQYPEGVPALSAPAADQDELQYRITDALLAAGLPLEATDFRRPPS